MLELKTICCPVCKSSQRKRIGDPKRIDEIFSSISSPDVSDVKVVACDDCSLIYLDPFPFFSDELLSKMYSNENEYFPEVNPKLAEIIHKKNPERRFDKAEEYANKEIKNYLEIGCGEGHALKRAKERGWNVQGQDISADFASIVKGNTGIDIKVGAINEDSFAMDSFDFIYVDSVLEHVPNPIEYMTSLKKFLAPGGVIYLTLPNENSLPNMLIDFVQTMRGKKHTSRIMPFAEPYHILGFSQKSIRKMAEEVGLEVPEIMCGKTYYGLDRVGKDNSLKKRAASLMHDFADVIDMGMNMEVVFVN
ncbi:class I SAM-dependent methyltransferase [Patescibacteria group bacterium]